MKHMKRHENQGPPLAFLRLGGSKKPGTETSVLS